ncbi:hypothetical protein M1105_00625 [Limibaculum sp. FT325]|uniref:hypothetical protein n=1 Tax=Thermohalobaculum sediminis TaxID=2939436 RepID=UPI0020BED451|nr:hypothetical protein [Limibaculum sediminis]MCL5775501.1 hypothetical protein [Limibaculum sediminis]
MIDKILRFLGIVATITLVALGAAFFASGEWEAWKAVRDARPDLAVAELRASAEAGDARLSAAETALAEAGAEIASLREALVSAGDEIEALRAAAVAEMTRVDAALAGRVAFGDPVRIGAAEGDAVLGLAAADDGAPAVTLADTGTWRLLKADQ